MKTKQILKTTQNAVDELSQVNIIIKNWNALDPVKEEYTRRQAIFNLKVLAADILQASIELEKIVGE